MFLCHKTEYPDELSFEKNKTNIPTAKCINVCVNGIEFDNYDGTCII